MNIILLGAPGSGKGTQAGILVKQRNMVQLSTGDMLRKARSSGSELGKQVAAIMDAGELVTDEIVIAMIAEQLAAQPDSNFIFDGFPRTLRQADSLDELLDDIDRPIDIAIELTVDTDSLIARITGRLSCGSCGATYHETTSPPSRTDICDHCDQPLRKRPDDNEDSLRVRLLEYYRQTAPITGYYHRGRQLRQVSSDGTIEEVAALVDQEVTSLG